MPFGFKFPLDFSLSSFLKLYLTHYIPITYDNITVSVKLKFTPAKTAFFLAAVCPCLFYTLYLLLAAPKPPPFKSEKQFLAAGQGIGVSSGQNPTVSNSGVLSLANQTGALFLTAGSGITIDGLKITNSDPGSSQKAFKTIVIGQQSFSAGSNVDTLTFAQGSGLTITADTSGKKITLSSLNQSGWEASGGTIGLAAGSQNVGIGTSRPGAKVEIAGNLKLSDQTLRGEIFTRGNRNLDQTWATEDEFNASGTAFSDGMQNPTVSGLKLKLVPSASPLVGWTYRRKITLTNPSASSLTDYPVALTLNTQTLISQGKLQAGCEDLRFTDDDGQSLLSYWLESGCGGSSTSLWVKVSTLPASANKEIYLYYGQAEAPSGKSGIATFSFFDDFNDEAISGSLWNTSLTGTGSLTESGGAVSLHTNASTSSSSELLGKSSFGSGVAIRFRANLSANQSYDHKVMGFLDGAIGYSAGSTNGAYFRGEDVNFQSTTSNSGGIASLGIINYYNFSYPTYSLWEIKWLAGSIVFFRNGSLYSTHTTRLPAGASPRFGLNTYNLSAPGAALDMSVDWVLVRQYVASEPTMSALGEETGFSVSYTSGEQTWLSQILDAGENQNYKPDRLTVSWSLDDSDNLPPAVQVLASATGAFAGEETTYSFLLNSGEEKDLSSEIGSFFRFWRIKVVLDTGANAGDTPIVSSLRLRDSNHYALNLQPYGQRVGVGTSDPTATLDVVGNASFSGSLNLRGTAALNILNGEGLEILTSPGGNAGLVSRLKLLGNGRLGLGNTAPQSVLAIAGLTESAGSNLVVDENGNVYKASSSERYKEEIKEFRGDFSKVLLLKPVSFQYKATGVKDIGYLAEDLENLGLKDLIIYDREGRPEAIKYDRIPLYLIEIIKSLKADLELLKDEGCGPKNSSPSGSL